MNRPAQGPVGRSLSPPQHLPSDWDAPGPPDTCQPADYAAEREDRDKLFLEKPI